MAIVADVCLCLKSSAKVIHFCELCKQKIQIFSTIKVNIQTSANAHNSAEHKPHQTRVVWQIYADRIRWSRVVPLYAYHPPDKLSIGLQKNVNILYIK